MFTSTPVKRHELRICNLSVRPIKVSSSSSDFFAGKRSDEGVPRGHRGSKKKYWPMFGAKTQEDATHVSA